MFTLLPYDMQYEIFSWYFDTLILTPLINKTISSTMSPLLSQLDKNLLLSRFRRNYRDYTITNDIVIYSPTNLNDIKLTRNCYLLTFKEYINIIDKKYRASHSYFSNEVKVKFHPSLIHCMYQDKYIKDNETLKEAVVDSNSYSTFYVVNRIDQ